MDMIAEIAARYGAGVAQGVTVQRLPTGATSRPLPVWDEAKQKLVVPDWKEHEKAARAASVKRTRRVTRKARAEDQAALQKVLELHAAGATTAAIAAACGISQGYCRSILSRSGLQANPDPQHKIDAMTRRQKGRVNAARTRTAARDAQILALVAAGADIDAIAAAVGLRNAHYLRSLLRRLAPDYAARFSWPVKGKPEARLRGPSRAEVRAERIRALVAEGAGLDRIASVLGMAKGRHLRRVVLRAVPDFDTAPTYLSDLAERDRLVAQLYPSLSKPQMAERLRLTTAQIGAAIKRARAAGLLAPASLAPPPKRDKRRPKGLVYLADQKARILDLHRRGLTIEAVMAETGLKRGPIARTLWAAGESVRNERSALTAARVAELPALVARGMTGVDIAAHWGVALNYVHSLAHRAQVSLTGRADPHNRGAVSPGVAARRDRVRAMVLRGMKQVDMMAELGISHATLSTDIKALGLSGMGLQIRRGAEQPERRAA